ncbi:MAG: hypothetical protein BIFFINMI_00758 [Phycisphaerae bacterium]|nr:hypothetical protein [Phycisphaerae bacterium]
MLHQTLLAACLALLSASSCALADGPPVTQPDAASASSADRQKAYLKFRAEVADQFRNRDYAAAAETCRRMIALELKQNEPWYNLACAQARLGKPVAALDALAQAVRLGYADPGHMDEDPDLESLRRLDRFADLRKQAAETEAAYLKSLYVEGEKIPGVRTLEGEPAAGLRWRLRMSPKATREKPARLIVWLHPSGGSMNQVVERMSPEFIARGYALLLPTAKDWRYWSSQDAAKLMDVTLPAVAKIEGIDARRPVLFGFSAGGQMALQLWHEAPSAWGGLVLDAAYPVVQTPRGMAMMDLPEGKPLDGTPMFVLVGDQDGGAKVWKKAEEPFGRAGVPLVVEYIPGKGHAWLFGPPQQKRLYDWLADLAAGKLAPPTTQPDGPVEEEIY